MQPNHQLLAKHSASSDNVPGSIPAISTLDCSSSSTTTTASSSSSSSASTSFTTTIVSTISDNSVVANFQNDDSTSPALTETERATIDALPKECQESGTNYFVLKNCTISSLSQLSSSSSNQLQNLHSQQQQPEEESSTISNNNNSSDIYEFCDDSNDDDIQIEDLCSNKHGGGGGGGADADPDENNPDDDCKDKSLIELYTDWLTNKTSQQQQPNLSSTTLTIPATITTTTTTTIPSSTSSTTNNTVKLSFSDSTKERADNLYNNLMKNSIQRISESLPLNSSTSSSCTVSSETLPFTSSSEVVASNSTTISFPKQLFGQTTSNSSGSDLFPIRKNSPWSWPNSNCTSTLTSSASSATTTTTSTSTSTYGSSNSSNVYVDNNYDINCDQLLLQHHLQQQQHQHQLMMNDSLSFGTMTGTNDGDDDDDDDQSNERKRLRLEDFMRQIVSQINSTSDKIWSDLLLDFTKNFAEYQVPYNKFVSNDYDLLLDIMTIAVKAMQSPEADRRIFSCQLLLNIVNLLNTELAESKVLPVLTVAVTNETCTTVRFNLCYVLAQLAPRLGFRSFVQTIYPLFQQMISATSAASSSSSSTTTTTTTTSNSQTSTSILSQNPHLPTSSTIAICFSTLDSLIYLLPYLQDYLTSCLNCSDCRNFVSEIVVPATSSADSTTASKTENLHSQHHQLTLDELSHFISVEFIPFVKQLFEVLFDYIVLYRSMPSVLEQDSLECFLQWKDTNRNHESITQSLFGHFPDFNYFVLLLRDHGLAMDSWTTEPAECDNNNNDDCWYLDYFYKLYNFVFLSIGNNHLQDNNQLQYGGGFSRSSNLVSSSSSNFHNLNKLKFSNQHYSFCSKTNDATNNNNSTIVEDDDEIVDGDQDEINTKPNSVNLITDQASTNESTNSTLLVSVEEESTKIKFVTTESVTKQPIQSQQINTTSSSNGQSNNFIGKFQITESVNNNNNNKQQFDVFGLASSATASAFAIASSKTSITSGNNPDIFGFFEYKTIHCKSSLISVIPIIFDLYRVTKSSKLAKVVCDSTSELSPLKPTLAVNSNSGVCRTTATTAASTATSSLSSEQQLFLVDRLIGTINSIIIDTNVEVMVKMINAFESLISRLTNPLRFYSILVNILQSQNIHVFNHLISNFFTIFSSMILNAVGSIRNMDSGSGNDGIGGDDVNSASNGDNVHSTIESVLVAFLKAEEFLSEKPNWRLYIQYLDVLLRLTRLVSMKSTKKLIVPRLLLRFETTRHIPCRQAISRCLLIIYIENFAELDFDRLIQDKIQRFDNQEQESKQHLDVDLFVWFEANLFNSTKYQMRQAFVDACAILLELFRTIRPDSVTKTPSDEGSKTQNLPKVDDNNNCNANHFLSDLRMLCPTMNSIDFQPKRTNQHNNNNNNGGFIPDNLASPPIAVVCNKLSKPLTSRLFLALLIQRHSLLQLLTSLATEDRVCTIRASAATVLRSLVQFFQKDILTSYAERSRASSLYCAAIESVFDYFDHFLSADGFEKFTAKTKLETDKLCSIEQQRFLHLIEECCENIYMLNKKSAMELATMDEDVEFCEINPVGNASDCGDENELVKSVQNEVNHLMDDLLTIVENELETDEDEEEDEAEELEVEELHEEELEEEEVDEDEFYLDDDEDDDEDNYYEIEQIINEKLSMNLPTLPKKTIIILGAEEEEEDDCYDDCDSTKMDTCPINEIDDELITSTSINQNQINGEEDVEMLLKSSSSSSSSTDSSSSSPDSSEVSTTDDSVSADQIKTEINKSISPCRGLIRIDSTLYNNSTTTTSSTTAPSTGASGNLTAANRKKKLKKNCSSSTTMVSASCTTTTTTASNGTTKSNNPNNNNQFSTKSIMSYHYPYSHSHNSNGAGGSPSNNSNNKRFLNSSMIPSMIASQQTVPAQQSHHQFFQYTLYHQVPQQQHQQIVGRSNTLKLAPIPPNNGTSPYLLTNPRQSSVSAHHQQQHGLSQSNTGSSSKKKNSSKTVRNYQQKSSPGATGPLSQGPLLQLPVSANHHSMNHHNQQQQQHHLTAQLSTSKLPIMYKQQQQQQQIAQYPPMLHSHHHHHPNNYPSPAASGGGAPFQQLIATPPNHHHHNHHHHPSHHHNHGNSNHVSSHHPSSTSSSSSFVPGPGSLPPPPPLSDPNLQFVHSNVSHKSASFHHNHHHGYSSPHHHHHGSPHNSHHNHHHNSNKLRGNISGSGGSRGGGGSGTGSNKHLRMVNGSGGGSTVANMPNNNRMMLMLNNNNNNYQQQPNNSNSNYLFNQNLNNNNNNNQASMANVALSKNNKTIGTLKKSNTTNSNKSKTATVAPPPPSQTVVKVLQRNVIVPSSAISNSLPVSANTSSTTTTSGSGSLPVTQSLVGTNQVVEDNNNNDSDKKNNKKKKKNGLDLDKTGGMVDSGQNSDDLMNANQP